MQLIIGVFVAVVLIVFVFNPLFNAVVKRYGVMGRVWYGRIFLLALIAISVLTNQRGYITTCLFVFMGINLLVNNPWTIRMMLQTEKEEKGKDNAPK